jgi:hydroxyacyl-ACP dehydratase HTD2-like protein with hotdog domain
MSEIYHLRLEPNGVVSETTSLVVDIIRGTEVSALPSLSLLIVSRRMRWARQVARMDERRVVYRFVVGKPKRKTQLGRPRRRWEDNINTELQEVGCGGIDWIDLAQDRDRWWSFVNAVMNLRVT